MAGEEQSSDSSVANRKDIGWKYAYLKNIKDRNSVTCKFCDKTTNGGISRHKKHLVGGVGLGVTKCTKCPSDVREEIMQSMVERKNEKEKALEEQYALKRKANFFDDSDDEEDAVDVQECGIGGSRHKTTQAKSNKKGPMDLFVTKKKAHATARQTSIVDAYDKEARKRVCRDICRFLYHGMIPFNVLNLEAFKKMVQSIGEYGPNLKTPSCHEARVPFLNDEVQYTKDLLKENVSETEKYGCSILSDGWSDRRGRTLINIIVNNAKGSMFMESFDASNTVKSGTLLFHFLDDFVERVGEKNVLQVVTDNGSNYVLAGKMLQNKRKNLFWTPCAAHSIDLMLEDIGKIPIINKTITRAGALVTFIYGHPSVLALMRTFTNDRELAKHGITRFATNFLTLQSLQRRRRDLRKMFVSEEWSKNMWSKDSRGKAIRDTVFQISFWNNVTYILKLMAPLVTVLRIADNEKTPSMGYIYEAMDRAKEAILKSFNNDPDKCQQALDIIDRRWDDQLHHPLHAAGYYFNPFFYYHNPEIESDTEVMEGVFKCFDRLIDNEELQNKIMGELASYKLAESFFGSQMAIRARNKGEDEDRMTPAQWWLTFGVGAPNLQKFAIRILNLTASASSCERNWSIFEHIHSKKRSRLRHDRLRDLVYVKYNQMLKINAASMRKRDPIKLRNIDDSNDEWMTGDAGNENILDDEAGGDGLTLRDFVEASGIEEEERQTRSRSRGKQPASKRTSASASSSKGKGKGKRGGRVSRSQLQLVDEESEEEFEDYDTEDDIQDHLDVDPFVSDDDDTDIDERVDGENSDEGTGPMELVSDHDE